MKITIILEHTSSYMYRALLDHHQGAHNNTKQLLNILGSYMQKMLSNCFVKFCTPW